MLDLPRESGEAFAQRDTVRSNCATQLGLVVHSPILAAAIRVMDQSLWRTPHRKSFAQGGEREVAVVNGTVKIPGSGKVKFPTLRFRFSGGLCGASIFEWASAAPGLDGRRWRNQGVGPDVLGQQIGMPTQAVTRAVDLDDDGMMQQPVEQRGCDHGAAEDVTPFRKAAVRGEDHRPLLVARIDQLEEQVASAGYDREVTDLIDDQERWSAVEPEPLAQGAFAFCFRQSADQVGKRDERHALARLDRLEPKRAGQVAFACARRTQEVYDLGSRNKVELS